MRIEKGMWRMSEEVHLRQLGGLIRSAGFYGKWRRGRKRSYDFGCVVLCALWGVCFLLLLREAESLAVRRNTATAGSNAFPLFVSLKPEEHGNEALKGNGGGGGGVLSGGGLFVRSRSDQQKPHGEVIMSEKLVRTDDVSGEVLRRSWVIARDREGVNIPAESQSAEVVAEERSIGQKEEQSMENQSETLSLLLPNLFSTTRISSCSPFTTRSDVTNRRATATQEEEKDEERALKEPMIQHALKLRPRQRFQGTENNASTSSYSKLQRHDSKQTNRNKHRAFCPLLLHQTLLRRLLFPTSPSCSSSAASSSSFARCLEEEGFPDLKALFLTRSLLSEEEEEEGSSMGLLFRRNPLSCAEREEERGGLSSSRRECDGLIDSFNLKPAGSCKPNRQESGKSTTRAQFLATRRKSLSRFLSPCSSLLSLSSYTRGGSSSFLWLLELAKSLTDASSGFINSAPCLPPSYKSLRANKKASNSFWPLLLTDSNTAVRSPQGCSSAAASLGHESRGRGGHSSEDSLRDRARIFSPPSRLREVSARQHGDCSSACHLYVGRRCSSCSGSSSSTDSEVVSKVWDRDEEANAQRRRRRHDVVFSFGQHDVSRNRFLLSRTSASSSSSSSPSSSSSSSAACSSARQHPATLLFSKITTSTTTTSSSSSPFSPPLPTKCRAATPCFAAPMDLTDQLSSPFAQTSVLPQAAASTRTRASHNPVGGGTVARPPSSDSSASPPSTQTPTSLRLQVKNTNALVEAAKTSVFLALWYVGNILYNVENKRALNLFPLPCSVAVLQMILGIPIFSLSWLLRLRAVPSLSSADWQGIRPFAIQGFWHSINHLSAVVALGAGAISFVHIVKAAEPAFTAALSVLTGGKALSPLTYLSLFPVIFGVSLASLKELSFTWTALMGSTASNIGSSMRGIEAKKALSGGEGVEKGGEKEEETADGGRGSAVAKPKSSSKPVSLGKNLTAPNIYALVTACSSVMLLPILLLDLPNWRPAFQKALLSSSSSASSGSGGALLPSDAQTVAAWKIGQHILASALWYYLYNEVAFVALKRLNPITHAVANTVKRVFLILTSVMVFNSKFTPMGAIGSAIAVAGTFAYSLSKQRFG